MSLPNQSYYVYKPINYKDEEVYSTNSYEVYDVEYTGEKWITREVEAELLFKIFIEKEIKTGEKFITKDDNIIPIFNYGWYILSDLLKLIYFYT